MNALQTPPNNTIRRILPRRAMLAMLALVAVAPLAACAGGPQESVSGTINYRERLALPSDAVLVVRLLDATRGDIAAYTVAEQRMVATPIPARFDVRYRYGDINPSGTYYLQAQIEQGSRVLFINDQNYSVITRNSPNRNVLVNLVPTAGTTLVPSAGLVAPAQTTTTTTVIQTTPGAPAPAATTTVVVPGGRVVTPQ